MFKMPDLGIFLKVQSGYFDVQKKPINKAKFKFRVCRG